MEGNMYYDDNDNYSTDSDRIRRMAEYSSNITNIYNKLADDFVRENSRKRKRMNKALMTLLGDDD